jgi:hypothetical protein
MEFTNNEKLLKIQYLPQHNLGLKKLFKITFVVKSYSPRAFQEFK